jgi:hypothetical protein
VGEGGAAQVEGHDQAVLSPGPRNGKPPSYPPAWGERSLLVPWNRERVRVRPA